MVTMVTRCTCTPSQLPVVEMSWGRKSKKKPSVLINLYFLVNFIRQTGPMVTSCTVTLFQLPVVEMSWGENLRKNLMFWQTFISWSISSDALVTWSPHVNRYTGYLSQLHSSTANILSAICHPSSIIRHLPSVICHPPSAICQLPSAMSWQYICSQLIFAQSDPSLTLKISISFVNIN